MQAQSIYSCKLTRYTHAMPKGYTHAMPQDYAYTATRVTQVTTQSVLRQGCYPVHSMDIHEYNPLCNHSVPYRVYPEFIHEHQKTYPEYSPSFAQNPCYSQ